MKLFLANIIMLAHLLLTLWFFLGTFAAIKYKKLRLPITLTLAAVIGIWQILGYCPFTVWESDLRLQAGHPIALSQSSFIQYYLNNWFHFFVEQKILDYGSYALLGVLFILDIDLWFRKKS